MRTKLDKLKANEATQRQVFDEAFKPILQVLKSTAERKKEHEEGIQPEIKDGGPCSRSHLPKLSKF